MIDVEGINITIAADTSRLESAARRAQATISGMGTGITNNLTNLRTVFANLTQTTAAFRAALQNMGLAPTAENIRILTKALKEEELQEKATLKAIQETMKARARAAKEAAQLRVTAVKAAEGYDNRVARERRLALEKAHNDQSTIANKSALYGGLASGTLIGGRFGFASGFFGGRIGANVGGAIGSAIAGTGSMTSKVLAGIGGGFGSIGGAALAAGAKVLQSALEISFHLMEKIAGKAQEFLFTSLKLGVEYEKQITSLSGLTGSKEKGSKLFSDIEKVAINSPYRTSQLIPQAEMLLGAGVKLDQIPAMLSRVGDIAGGDMEKFHFVAKALGDTKAVGHLRGQELNQFANQGISREDFAETMGLGKNLFKFNRKLEAGEVSYGIVAETINRLTSKGGRFADRGQEISTQTVGGALDSLGETMEGFQKKFGEVVLRKFNVAEILNKVLNNFGTIDMGAVEKWVGRAANAFKPLGAVLLKFGDYLMELGMSVAKSLPTWEELGSVFIDSVNKYLPFFIESMKSMGIVVLGVGRLFLKVTDWLIGAVNYITQSKVFKKVIGDVGEIPQIARARTIDKWFKDMQDGLKKSPDANKFFLDDGKKSTGALSKIFNQEDGGSRDINQIAKLDTTSSPYNKHMLDLSEKINKEIDTGTSAYEKFGKGIARLNFSAQKQGQFGPLIDEKEYKIGVLDFYKALEHDMKEFLDHQPTTAAYGSGTAQDIVNANVTMQTMNIQERTLAVIEAAKLVQEQQKEVQQKIFDAIKGVATKEFLSEFGL